MVWGMAPNRYSPENSGLSVSWAQHLRSHTCTLTVLFECSTWVFLGICLSPVSLVRNKGDYTWSTLCLVYNQRLSIGNRTETGPNSKWSKFSKSLSHSHFHVFLQTLAALDNFTPPFPSYFTRQFPNSPFNIAENISPGNKKIKHSIFTFKSYNINHLHVTTTWNILLSQTWTLLSLPGDNFSFQKHRLPWVTTH